MEDAPIPATPAVHEDAKVETFDHVLLRELATLAAAVPKLYDGDPTNNRKAVLDVIQSSAVIFGALSIGALSLLELVQKIGGM